MSVTETQTPQPQLDIERFVPVTWQGIVGNDALKAYFLDMIWCVRKEGHRSGFNLLATGPSRAGKTSLIRFGVKCLLCCNFDYETMNPCQTCENCRSRMWMNGTGEWNTIVDFADADQNPTPVRSHYIPVDCTRFKESDLEEVVCRLRVNDGNLKIVYLDEVHRLVRRGIDEMLLKPIEDYPAIWMASSAVLKKENINDTHKLEKMFQNRFDYRLETELPEPKEMIGWLIDRCKLLGLQAETPETTLPRLMERSNRVPGMALQVLNKAHKTRNKILTQKMVENHIFDFDN